MKTNRTNYDQQVLQFKILIEETQRFRDAALENREAAQAAYKKINDEYNHWANRLNFLKDAEGWILEPSPLEKDEETDNV